jgi:hypothetical protein
MGKYAMFSLFEGKMTDDADPKEERLLVEHDDDSFKLAY